MASRGVVNKLGVVTTFEYSAVVGSDFKNAIVLSGNNGIHGLPDYSHSKPDRIYVKLDDRGFREMRIYDQNGVVILEIGYHPEKNLSGNNRDYVLHYHTFSKNLEHSKAHRMTNAVYNKYKEYLNHWGIYWHE